MVKGNSLSAKSLGMERDFPNLNLDPPEEDFSVEDDLSSIASLGGGGG